MASVEEAQELLRALGLPTAQTNEIAALTLLSLAGLRPDAEWSRAATPRRRVHDLLTDMAASYDREYAENTRETVRRQVIHQLEQAGIVDRNPDDRSLATNSPKTHYALTESVLPAVQAFGADSFPEQVERFHAEHGALADKYRAERELNMVPVTLPDGTELKLSPGEHNVVQAAIVEQFGPRFAPGASVLYLGDTSEKMLALAKEDLVALGIPVGKHTKLPDVLLYSVELNRLFLIEAVTSHGPMSPKRKAELEALLEGCDVPRVYVTAFPDVAEFKRHLADIAWETEVWLAAVPDHLIHFNGDRFLP